MIKLIGKQVKFYLVVLIIFIVFFSGCTQSSQETGKINPTSADTMDTGSQVRPATTYETYQPTSLPTTPEQQRVALTSVLGKTLILRNIKESGQPSSVSRIEFKFGYDYVIIREFTNMWSEETFGEARITEERNPNSLIVKAIVKEAGKDGTLTWRIEDDGTLVYTLQIQGISSTSYVTGDWSIQ